MTFEAWQDTLLIDAGPDQPYDRHNVVFVSEFHTGGRRYIRLKDAATAFRIPLSTLRDNFESSEFSNDLRTVQESDQLSILKTIGAVALQARGCAFVKLWSLGRLLHNTFGLDDNLLSGLRTLRNSPRVDLSPGPSSHTPVGIPAIRRSSLTTAVLRPLHEDQVGPSAEDDNRIITDLSIVKFPSELRRHALSERQRSEPYGLDKHQKPTALSKDVRAFKDWSVTDFNFSRGMRYSRSVQSETIDGHIMQIRAYMGYLSIYHDVPLDRLNLNLYAKPELIVRFLAFLIARQVGKGHLMSHISLARKINDFLRSDTSRHRTDGKAFFARLDEWMAVVEAQVNAVYAKRSAPRPVAEMTVLLQWGRQKCSIALDMFRRSMQSFNYERVTQFVAQEVQDAIVVALATGAFAPPCRINLIKTLNHPFLLSGCDDPDCWDRTGTCLGNRIVVQVKKPDGSVQEAPNLLHPETWSDAFITIHVVHGKTDRAPRACDIHFKVPETDLKDLLLAHIYYGHEMMTLQNQTTKLITSKTGRSLDSVGFSIMWRDIMERRCPVARQMQLQYFPATAARTAFVQDYTGASGVSPDFWDGAAAVMGSSQRQFTDRVYFPYKKSRNAQRSVDGYEDWAKSMIARVE